MGFRVGWPGRPSPRPGRRPGAGWMSSSTRERDLLSCRADAPDQGCQELLISRTRAPIHVDTCTSPGRSARWYLVQQRTWLSCCPPSEPGSVFIQGLPAPGPRRLQRTSPSSTPARSPASGRRGRRLSPELQRWDSFYLRALTAQKEARPRRAGVTSTSATRPDGLPPHRQPPQPRECARAHHRVVSSRSRREG
jgi:hypothetical protein